MSKWASIASRQAWEAALRDIERVLLATSHQSGCECGQLAIAVLAGYRDVIGTEAFLRHAGASADFLASLSRVDSICAAMLEEPEGNA